MNFVKDFGVIESTFEGISHSEHLKDWITISNSRAGRPASRMLNGAIKNPVDRMLSLLVYRLRMAHSDHDNMTVPVSNSWTLLILFNIHSG